jgi:hypothetical protein
MHLAGQEREYHEKIVLPAGGGPAGGALWVAWSRGMQEALVSGRGRHHRPVTVALDDRGHVPVLVRRDFRKPPSCWQPVRC